MIRELQIGKKGVDGNFVENLKSQFEKVQSVRISVLKSARENKQDVKNISNLLLEKLGNNYTLRIVGFTIILKKWRKDKAVLQ